MANLPSDESEDDGVPCPEETARFTREAIERSRTKRPEAKPRAAPPSKKRRCNESGSDFSAGSDASMDSEENDSEQDATSESASDTSGFAIARRPTGDTATLLLLEKMARGVDTRVVPLLSPSGQKELAVKKNERGKTGMKLVEARFEMVVRAFEMQQAAACTPTTQDVNVLTFLENAVEGVETLFKDVNRFRSKLLKRASNLTTSLEGQGAYASP